MTAALRSVTLRRPVIKFCPFRPETDAGNLELVLPTVAPELHGLDSAIDGLCAGASTHEDFTMAVAGLAALPEGTQVTTWWQTGAFEVEVAAVAGPDGAVLR